MTEEEVNLRLATLHENICFRTYLLRQKHIDIYGKERVKQALATWEEAQELFRLAYKIVQKQSGYERADAIANGATQ